MHRSKEKDREPSLLTLWVHSERSAKIGEFEVVVGSKYLPTVKEGSILELRDAKALSYEADESSKSLVLQVRKVTDIGKQCAYQRTRVTQMD